MKSHMKIESHPQACAENIVQGDKYRITVLTDRLWRLEYSEDGVFEDAATQTVLNRNFPKVDFEVKDTEEGLQIKTKCIQLDYDKKEFSSHGLSCRFLGNITSYQSVWHYGEKIYNLKGTARTLDTIDGACELEDGIISRVGCAVLDDAASLTLAEDGWVKPRKKGIIDLYFFGYGVDYLGALKDFYYLCGKTPMLPRFALGNWWSRYYKYTEDSYMELMERFDEEKVPFSVAVIDMDWHLVDVDPKYGSGWTGYTWNRDFFPDPERFLKKLHDRGMKTTLNVHPADGIRAFEDLYPGAAKAMGVDMEKEEPVEFDIADPKFLDVYFDEVHHPLEEQGVDFWWLDWQQGKNTKTEGLDPLWMLNHFHFLDSARDGKRPMTFSRYAGPGSHRYPVGFSGDTVVTWESLDFQPYFTNTASNIGYGWWSHDIGGHMMGYKDDEMETRWYQYGVFSPINRLHSTSSEFNGKEPWRFKVEAHNTMNEFLRLRHRLVPYLYTMNYRSWHDDQPLIWPMYYVEPMNWDAYKVKNQYLFGSELMVAPITTKRIGGINAAKVTVLLPKGLWFDFFRGTVYRGGRMMTMYRPIDTIPVLAKAGAIIPMTEKISAKDVLSNPDQLTIRVYAGADNTFELYEDDGATNGYAAGDCVKTPMRMEWTKRKAFTMGPAKGNTDLVPESRTIRVELIGSTAASAEVLVNGEKADAAVTVKGSKMAVELGGVHPFDQVEIILPKETAVAANPIAEQVYDFLNQAEIPFMNKEAVYRSVLEHKDQLAVMIGELQSRDISEDLKGALIEILTAY